MFQMSNSLKLQWLDHFDGSWSREDVATLATRQGVVFLHQKLINNKETLPIPHATLEFRGPNLPEYERGLTSVSCHEQDEFLNEILYSQLSLARTVCCDSPFYCTLRRRILVLQRIFSALTNKYHCLSSKPVTCLKKSNCDKFTSITKDNVTTSETKEGSAVLVEMGVKTGLSLLFALFRQSWQLNNGQLCHDVLLTACDVLSSIRPLSLSNESKLPPMGLDCLRQVTSFLKGVLSPSSAADALGRQLASELFLRITALRGSLKYLLEWIEMALSVTCISTNDGNKPAFQTGISVKCLHDIIIQIRKSMSCSASTTPLLSPKKDETNNIPEPELPSAESGLLSLPTAAICLLQEIVRLSKEYKKSCINPGVNTLHLNGSKPLSNDEVFVWGSNSSHQLAEGSTDKILSAKRSASFGSALQVEAGQYCTFVISPEGTLHACGKGSYGRLGLGDSVNQQQLKRVSVLADCVVKKVSSSKGSDGHTLALTTDGQVYSWGDGM